MDFIVIVAFVIIIGKKDTFSTTSRKYILSLKMLHSVVHMPYYVAVVQQSVKLLVFNHKHNVFEDDIAYDHIHSRKL